MQVEIIKSIGDFYEVWIDNEQYTVIKSYHNVDVIFGILANPICYYDNWKGIATVKEISSGEWLFELNDDERIKDLLLFLTTIEVHDSIRYDKIAIKYGMWEVKTSDNKPNTVIIDGDVYVKVGFFAHYNSELLMNAIRLDVYNKLKNRKQIDEDDMENLTELFMAKYYRLGDRIGKERALELLEQELDELGDMYENPSNYSGILLRPHSVNKLSVRFFQRVIFEFLKYYPNSFEDIEDLLIEMTLKNKIPQEFRDRFVAIAEALEGEEE